MIRKKLLIAISFISLGLGAIGIFIPLLLTTPFIILAAFCFLKSSRARYEWLINHRILGKYIADYVTQRAMPLGVKIRAIIFMWLAMSISALLVSNRYLAIILFVIGFAVTLHILSLRTILKTEKKPGRADETVQ